MSFESAGSARFTRSAIYASLSILVTPDHQASIPDSALRLSTRSYKLGVGKRGSSDELNVAPAGANPVGVGPGVLVLVAVWSPGVPYGAEAVGDKTVKGW